MANDAYVVGKGARRFIRPPKKVNTTPIGTDADYGQLAIIASSGDTWVYHGDGNWNQIGTSSTDPVDVPHGGTGLATITDHGVMVGSGTAAVTPLAVGATGTVLAGATGADPAFSATPSVTTLTSTNLFAPAATNLTIKMGDAAGSNSVNFVDSASATKALVDSSGNVSSYGNMQILGAGKYLQIEGGAVTDYIGTCTLSNGVATVLNTNIAAADHVYLTRTSAAASTALGGLQVTINAGVSFVVTSLQMASPGATQTGDLSVLKYVIIKQGAVV